MLFFLNTVFGSNLKLVIGDGDGDATKLREGVVGVAILI
jgi:F420-0:gamma-glutamyl ligase